MFEEGVAAEASGRVRVERGPVSMVVSAWKDGTVETAACLRAADRVDGLLAELTAEMPLLVRPWPLTSPRDFVRPAAETGAPGAGTDESGTGGIGMEKTGRGVSLGRRMWQAARATGHPEMTPLCAVAGAVADAVADAVVAELGFAAVPAGPAIKVIVNNGGDVTLRLSPGLSASVGLIPALGAAGPDETVRVDASTPVRGIATSGLGGRGMTRGVADAVSVFAASGVQADALATCLGNASRIESPRVRRALAGTLRPGCDIADLDVTVEVGALTEAEKALALDGIKAAAQPLMDAGILFALRAAIQGSVLWMPGIFTDRNA